MKTSANEQPNYLSIWILSKSVTIRSKKYPVGTSMQVDIDTLLMKGKGQNPFPKCCPVVFRDPDVEDKLGPPTPDRVIMLTNDEYFEVIQNSKCYAVRYN